MIILNSFWLNAEENGKTDHKEKMPARTPTTNDRRSTRGLQILMQKFNDTAKETTGMYID